MLPLPEVERGAQSGRWESPPRAGGGRTAAKRPTCTQSVSVSALLPVGRGETSPSKSTLAMTTEPLEYVADSVAPPTSDNCRVTGESPNVIVLVIALVTGAMLKPTVTTCCVPGENASPKGSPTSRPTLRERFEWTTSEAPGAPLPSATRKSSGR